MQLRVADPPIKFELRRYAEPAVVNGEYDDRAAPIEKLPVASFESAKALADPVEWSDNKAVAACFREFQAGDIEELSWMQDGKLVKNGYLRVMLSPTAHIKLTPEDYTGTPPQITVPQKVIDALDQSKMATVCKSIVDGVLELA